MNVVIEDDSKKNKKLKFIYMYIINLYYIYCDSSYYSTFRWK